MPQAAPKYRKFRLIFQSFIKIGDFIYILVLVEIVLIIFDGAAITAVVTIVLPLIENRSRC